MANPYNRVYPPRGRLFFDGGKNNKFEQALIPDNESPDCKNVIFENGAVETRGGITKKNPVNVASAPCVGLYTRKDNAGTESMVGFWAGNGYVLGVTTFVTIPSAQSVFTADTKVYGAQYENYLFVGNKVANYKYNGAYTRHGVPAPAGVVSGLSDTSSQGNVNTDVQYKVAYVNSALVEGNIGSGTATLAIASGQVLVTDLPLAPQSYGVNARRLYRADSGATYLRVAEISDNTTTSYVDNKATADLGSEGLTDANEPSEYSAIIYHQNRLFYIDANSPNLLKYTDLNNPYVQSSTNFIRVGDNTTDLARALSIYDNNILVFCDNSIWLIYMSSTSPSDWRSIRVRSPYGCKSPFAPIIYKNKVLFPAVQNDIFVGFAAVSGTSTDPSATLLTVSAVGSDLKSDRIEPDMFTINRGKVSDISGLVYKNKAYFSVPYGLSQLTNNRIYLFDFSETRLSKRQDASWAPWTGMNAAHFTVYDGTLFYGNSDSAFGAAHEMNTSDYNDNGSAIDSYYWTKEFSGNKGEEYYHKDFRYVYLFHELSGAYYMDFSYRQDSASDDGTTTQIDLDPGGAIWDDATSIWDTSTWDSGQLSKETKHYLGQLGGKRIQFKFSNQNTVNQKFKILGMTFAYNRKGRR